MFSEEEIKEVNEKTNPAPKPAKEVKAEVLVKIDKSGVFNFNNQIELSTAAKFAIQVKLAPEHLRKEGVEAVAAALTLCRQFKLPMSAMNEMAYVKGKIVCYGSLITALAERHPEYGEIKVQYVDEKQDIICLANKNLNAQVWACVVSIKKKNSSEWVEFYFTYDEAKQAGLTSNNTYQKYLKDMLWHKCKMRAFRTCYSSALNGIEDYESLKYEVLAEKDVTPNINERLKEIRGENGSAPESSSVSE